jgi:CRISPR-associated protein Cmr2
VLYDGRLLEALDESGAIGDRDQRAALDALHRFRSAVGRTEPQGYYAILHADGDRMGRVIDANGHAAHVRLSAKLVEFARAVESVVRAHQGSLVYSGGDDVLALLPLHRAVACATELAARFEADLAEFCDAEGHSPTLSAGLAVVHHLTPFDAALDVARRAEKLAKKTRDALAIVVDKRGGAEVAVTGSWKTFVPQLARLVALHRLGVVSGKAGHALAELALLTRNVAEGDRPVFAAMARSEASRVLARSHEEGGGRALDGSVRRALEAMIPEGELNAAGWLGEMLVVASNLARVADEAGQPKPATVEEVLR